MEVVYEGWLVKSPPEKRIRRAKWRRRWFVLRPSGQVPQQYVLEYYTDQTYRKLKGTIDLDQCDQVDAGLEVDTKSKFMFDVKTSKRTYYLVADSEAIMNKWVDCICNVCGLKIQVEEEPNARDAETVEPNPSPEQPEQPPRPDSVGNLYSTGSSVPTDPPPLVQTLPERGSPKDDSNPYIPISECITGKPIGDRPGSNLNSGTRLSDFYDVPRCGTGRTSPDPVMDAMCRMPRPPDRSSCGMLGPTLSDAVPPPSVNWSTHPKDGSDPPNGQCSGYDPVPPVRPASSGSEGTDSVSQRGSNVYNGDTLGRAGLTIRKMGRAAGAPPRPPKTWNGGEDSYDQLPPTRSASSGNVDSASPDMPSEGDLPPRPPKPANIRVRPSLSGQDAYDVPPPLCHSSLRISGESYDIPRPTEHDGYSIPPCPQPVLRSDGYDVPKSSRTSYDAYDVPKPAAPPSPSSKTSGGTVAPPRSSLDEAYDFPKSSLSPDLGLGASIPPPGQNQRSRVHAYCNAPVGTFNSWDNIFNYEYRPSLMDSRDDTDPQQATGVPYANVSTSPGTPNLTAVPPAINRGLKPRKASSENSIALPVFPLAPPPVTRNCSHASFTRQRHRSKGDLLAPEEDNWSNASGSRRNSTNEDPVVRQTSVTGKKKGEIQYLDLDLDSDPGPAQSPRSPEQKATGSNTVYRTVDFLKTKAFNRTRQNVEESYRSHRDGEPCK